MPATMQQQKGLTLISWMVVIAIALFFALIGVKMTPVYMENFSMKQVLAGLEQDRRVSEMSGTELKQVILKRFKINGVYDFNKNDLKLKPGKKGTEVKVEYEVRKPIVGNVSVLMAFSESVEIRK